MYKRKMYYIVRHILYGLKVEMGVLRNMLSIFSSSHYPGSVADNENSLESHVVNLWLLLKIEREMSLIDN